MQITTSIGLRRAAALTAAALSLTATITLPVTAAHATGIHLLCTGQQSPTYSPPLTNTTQQTTVNITETYGTSLHCLDTAGIQSGSGTFTVSEPASCTSLTQPGTVSYFNTYTWNNGQSSTIHFTNVNVARLLDGTTQVIASGTVSSGFGLGDTAARTVTLPQLDPTLCSTTGVASQQGVATMTFISA
ncbi:hypothetical protein [Kitasatospora purpeofusca]|uniref:hypothetical protein n=1 Tax=Kitasatospora purpeofusca TaxID=67352 RepID=UPI0036550B0F